MVDKVSVTTIRHQLKHTWRPFFTRFGRLTAIQVEAIPKVLAGHNIVSAAPTASGKTESVVAPVAELGTAQRWQGLSVLYIVPTRALANDSLARIEGPLSELDFKTILKHGDKPYLPKRPPNWLITTPESLDSLLCRQIQLLKTVRVVIIDEIHLLDNTYRGDQLRLLLVRLNQISQHAPLSVHLLSATLPDPAAVARRYIDPCEIVSVAGQRQIERHLLDSHQAIFQLARQRRWHKVLYFCNRRAAVEETAATIAPLWGCYPVVSHHGSLDRHIREEAEQVMKEAKVAACVATSTLEIGIDIGDIDLVVLVEPPISLSAMLQRVGRGNRRSGKIQAAALFSSDAERVMLESLFDAADQPFDPSDYKPDLSVAVQQSFSYLFQNRQGVTREELCKLLKPLCSEAISLDILEHLIDEELILTAGQKLYLSEAVMNLTVRGEIHSNIPSQLTLQVIDITSGQNVGTISDSFDTIFTLAGRTWQIQSKSSTTVRVKPYRGRAKAAQFKRCRNAGKFHPYLPDRYRQSPTPPSLEQVECIAECNFRLAQLWQRRQQPERAQQEWEGAV